MRITIEATVSPSQTCFEIGYICISEQKLFCSITAIAITHPQPLVKTKIVQLRAPNIPTDQLTAIITELHAVIKKLNKKLSDTVTLLSKVNNLKKDSYKFSFEHEINPTLPNKDVA